MIECTVLGFGVRPYDFQGNKGVSYKLSVSMGDYPVDHSKGVSGQGTKVAEYKCSEKILNGVSVGYKVGLEVDDTNSRVKSAFLITDDGYYVPIE